MIRLLFLLLFCLPMIGAQPALAQPPPASGTAALTPAQARAALEVLGNPQKRAEISRTLEAIAKAQPAPTPAPAPAKPAKTPATPIQLAPNGLGAEALLGAEKFINHSAAEVSSALRAMQSVPLLWSWAVMMATDPWARGILLDVAWRLVVVMICALAVQYGLRRAVRRPVAALEGQAQTAAGPEPEPLAAPQDLPPDHPAIPEDADPDTALTDAAPADTAPPVDNVTAVARAEAGDIEPPAVARRRIPALALLRRLPLVTLRLLLDLVPVLGFVVTGHLLTATSLGGIPSSQLVILAVLSAYATCVAVLAIARMLLSPGSARLRLFNVPDKLATYLMLWTRRIVAVAVFGYAIAEVGQLLGLSDVAHTALMKADGFVLHVFLGIMVLQKQRRVRHWLRAAPDATGAMAWLRNAFASVWHWIALFFLAASWLVWAVEIPNGFARMLHFCVVTALLLVGARLLLIVLDGSLDRALQVPAETSARYPGLEARLRLYHPAVSTLLRGVVYLLCMLAMLQLYGVAAFAWFAETDLGQHMVSACGTMLVTLVLALLAWEAANAAFQRHLAKLAKEQQLARSARLRTLMPLIRSALLITIVIFAGLTVLSEIGINIAPLLAGAGIVGVAVGFGSQKLVQDFITGIFLLLENAMQVGEGVTVAGLSGTVEALSVRTMRLRAGDGSVHIIPFSSVTTVTNVNRGLGNASVSVTVNAEEDTDRVAAVLTEIVAGMRQEPDFAGKMLSDLQLWGVDKVDGAGATMAGQVVCTDSGRWAVQREFNRRMKIRFQELGIQLYNPMHSVAVTLLPPELAAKEPAVKEPAVKDPAAKDPAAKDPAVEDPVVEEKPHERSRAAE